MESFHLMSLYKLARIISLLRLECCFPCHQILQSWRNRRIHIQIKHVEVQKPGINYESILNCSLWMKRKRP